MIAGLLVLAGLVAAAFALDPIVLDWWLGEKHIEWRGLAEFFSEVGEWGVIAALCAGGFLVAWWRNHPHWMRTVLLMLAASSLAGIIVNPLRAATGRARPSARVAPGWHGLQKEGQWLVGKHKYSSFPSAHSAVAMAFVVPLLWFSPRLGVCGFGFALAVMWSRVYLGAHHLSDVITGGAIGAVSGSIVCIFSPMRRWECAVINQLTRQRTGRLPSE